MKVLACSAFRLGARRASTQQQLNIARKLNLKPVFYPVVALTQSGAPISQALSIGNIRFFASDDGSHEDFAPKRKTIDDIDEAVRLIGEHVKSNRIMLYMKGNPSMPMCGFSARVVQILRKEGVDFASVNVLDYPNIREGVKKYSDWPTIPQLYVDAEFVGGCDVSDITGMCWWLCA